MKAAGAMLKHEFHTEAPLGAYSLTREDFLVLQSPTLWHTTDRIQVERTLAAMRDGLAQGMGFTPFAVPAEWAAAVIANFVHPVNRRTACAWTANVYTANADIINSANVGVAEQVSAQQIFGLVLLAEQDGNEFQSIFDSKVKKAQIRQQQLGEQQ